MVRGAAGHFQAGAPHARARHRVHGSTVARLPRRTLPLGTPQPSMVIGATARYEKAESLSLLVPRAVEPIAVSLYVYNT